MDLKMPTPCWLSHRGLARLDNVDDCDARIAALLAPLDGDVLTAIEIANENLTLTGVLVEAAVDPLDRDSVVASCHEFLFVHIPNIRDKSIVRDHWKTPVPMILELLCAHIGIRASAPDTVCDIVELGDSRIFPHRLEWDTPCVSLYFHHEITESNQTLCSEMELDKVVGALVKRK